MGGPGGFKQQLVYATEYPLVSRTLHRLRLGFFTNRKDAENASAKLSDDYPQAWIARADERERTAALRSSGLKEATLPRS